MLYITPIVIRSIINYLASKNKITSEQSKQYIARINEENVSVLEEIIQKNYSDDSEIAAIIAEAFNLNTVSGKELQSYKKAFPSIPSEFIVKNQVIPFYKNENQAHVAFTDPSKAVLTNTLQKILSCTKIKFFIAQMSDIKVLLNIVENSPTSDDTDISSSNFLRESDQKLDYQADAVVVKVKANKTQKTSENVSNESVIQLAQEILLEAIDKKASDIHIERLSSEKSRICFRINGALYYQDQLNERLHPVYQEVLSRFKVLADCDISEHRLPQDGSFTFQVDSHEDSVDLRFSVINTKHGERIVMRILSSSGAVDIHNLGLKKKNQEILLNCVNQNQGMVLVTGPTGSGKTTTLYSVLKYLNDGSRSLFSVEDPIEYSIEGIAQCQIQPKINLNFSSYLRAFLRQDPEVILVGEIRDQETVDIGIKAALTGHLILSTLHANHAVSAVDRLRDLGIDDFLIAYAVNLIIAQRLVRKNCMHCLEEDSSVTQDVLKSLFDEIIAGTIEAKSSKGCPRCNYTGYLDRVPIFEFFPFDDEIRSMIIKKASQQSIIGHLEYMDFPRFKRQAIDLIREGQLSIKEYQRVVA